MVRIVFCDDEKIIREKYAAYLEKLQNLYSIEIDLTIYSQADYLMANKEDWIDHTDILLLDIEMGEHNGVEVAQILREEGYMGEIVFLTVSKAYVFDSFNVNPMQYILKTKDDFDSFYEKFTGVISKLNKNHVKMFNYQIGKDSFFVPLKFIISFEVKKRIIVMAYIDQNGVYQSVEFYMTLANIEEKTKGMYFIKVHRAFLVNPAYINAFKSKEVIMINNKLIPLSRFYAGEAKEKFCAYLELKGTIFD